jgi:hypothetical protein
VRVGNKSTGVTANFLVIPYRFVPLILSAILILLGLECVWDCDFVEKKYDFKPNRRK